MEAPQPQFTRFPDLALELQQSIWTFAALLAPTQPRLQRLTPEAFLDTYADTTIPDNAIFARPTQPVPAILHCCKESRKIALPYYELWPTLSVIKEVDGGDKKWVFVNRAQDIFYFGRPPPTSIFGSDVDLISVLGILSFETLPSEPDFEIILGQKREVIKSLKGIKNLALCRRTWEKEFETEIEVSMRTKTGFNSYEDIPLEFKWLLKESNLETFVIVTDNRNEEDLNGGEMNWHLEEVVEEGTKERKSRGVWDFLGGLCPDLWQLKQMYVIPDAGNW